MKSFKGSWEIPDLIFKETKQTRTKETYFTLSNCPFWFKRSASPSEGFMLPQRLSVWPARGEKLPHKVRSLKKQTLEEAGRKWTDFASCRETGTATWERFPRHKNSPRWSFQDDCFWPFSGGGGMEGIQDERWLWKVGGEGIRLRWGKVLRNHADATIVLVTFSCLMPSGELRLRGSPNGVDLDKGSRVRSDLRKTHTSNSVSV